MLPVAHRHAVLRSIQVPPELYQTYTGSLWRDGLPLATMLCSVPALWLFWWSRRYTNFVLFSIGFFFASAYHASHLNAKGLDGTYILGVNGVVWRTYDILWAQWLLGRTLGETLGAHHPLSWGLSNAVFPAAVVAMFHLRDTPTLLAFGRVLALIFLATAGSKAMLEGCKGWPTTLWSYGGARALAFFVAAFVCFPMPARFPKQYWLFHSLWHVFCSFGYWDLYCCLSDCPAYPWIHQRKKPHAKTRARQA